jgi:hypothetical protein
MARALSVRRSNVARAVPLPSHWDKETSVSRRERHPPQLREIQSPFEPSRLSLAWLAQADEQVVPMVRRTTSGPLRRRGEEAAALQRHSSQGLSPCVGGSQQHG